MVLSDGLCRRLPDVFFTHSLVSAFTACSVPRLAHPDKPYPLLSTMGTIMPAVLWPTCQTPILIARTVLKIPQMKALLCHMVILSFFIFKKG